MNIATGTRIKHYDIRSRIGAGGMGQVYLAEDTQLRRKVAIKFLPEHSVADQRAKSRLLREARAAATLDHPNICAIYEIGEESGHSFIVLQFIEGETLRSRLKKGPLDLQNALEIAWQIADALSEAHKKGIVHRDIKPENIMLTDRNQVKVLDFGLAKIVREENLLNSDVETATELSVQGTITGTIPYMSPEQVRGEELDARSDIFSYGIVLYEMLCGSRPFDARSSGEIISAILTQEPRPFSQSFSSKYPDLHGLVLKCMRKELTLRYQTMADLMSDLEKIRRAPENQATAVVSRKRQDQQPNFARAGWIVVFIALVAAAGSYFLFLTSPKKSAATRTSGPVNSKAYESYIRARVKINNQNQLDNESAIELLEKAVEADPNYAPAYAELARAYGVKAFYFSSPDQMKQLTEDAEVAIQKALALDPNLADAHTARAFILWTHIKGFPHELAIQSYKRALALNPNLDEAHHQLVIYFHIGLLDKAQAEIEKSLALNPNNTMARFRLGIIQLYRGNYENALNLLKGIPPTTNPLLRERAIGTTLFQLGRYDEAETLTKKFLKMNQTDEGGAMTSVWAMLLARSGKQKEAEEAIARAIEIGKDFGHFHHTSYNVAAAYAFLNKPEEAVQWLQATAEDGFPCYPLFETDPNLNNLRKDARFVAFMTKLKQQFDHYKATL